MRLGVSPTTTTPTGFYSQRFWGFISLQWNPGLHSLSRTPIVPPSLSTYECGTTWSASHHLGAGARPPHPRLPVSTHPTRLDECFFFNSMVVGLPYSSIFWQFWLVFVFKSVVVLLYGFRGKWNLSTYASILAGNSRNIWLKIIPQYTQGSIWKMLIHFCHFFSVRPTGIVQLLVILYLNNCQLFNSSPYHLKMWIAYRMKSKLLNLTFLVFYDLTPVYHFYPIFPYLIIMDSDVPTI